MLAHRDGALAVGLPVDGVGVDPDAEAAERMRKKFMSISSPLPGEKETTARVLYATKLDFAEPAPRLELMDRERAGVGLDPAQQLMATSYAEMQQVLGYNSYSLHEFFRAKGFRELPQAVLNHNIAGSLLGAIRGHDIDKLGLSLLGMCTNLYSISALEETITGYCWWYEWFRGSKGVGTVLPQVELAGSSDEQEAGVFGAETCVDA